MDGMLRSLLSPLSGKFPMTPLSATSTRPDLTPRTPHPDEDEVLPEEFARDVLVEVMKNTMERLKLAEGLNSRTQVLVEVHGIMTQDACTKDIFRDMDGFLVLMNVLSTIQPSHSWAVAESGDHIVHEVLEAVRLIFAILSEAMDNHQENAAFFERSVGFELFEQAVLPLVSDQKTVEQTLGFLASLATHNFSLSGVFLQCQENDYETIDHKLQDAEPMFKLIRHPGALRVLFASRNMLPKPNDFMLRYSIYKFLERLAVLSHRNHAIMNSLNFVGILFETYYNSKIAASEKGEGLEDSRQGDTLQVLPKQERSVIMKLLRRLLELGAGTDVARAMFQRAVRADDTLDADVLEVLRAGMKTRWPDHLSLESPASLVVPDDTAKGLPQAGFTFLTWLWIEKFPVDSTHPIFSYRLGGTTVFSLFVRSDGTLGCRSTASLEQPVFKPALQLYRWTHIALVHYPHRSSAPTIRLFVDGVLSDVVNWAYPKPTGFGTGAFVIGDASESSVMSWSIASAHLISLPLGDDAPRYIQHLGPRYAGRFQADNLAKFMTYEASTSLSIFLYGVAQAQQATAIGTYIKSGLGVNASSVIFTLTPSSNHAELASAPNVDEASLSGVHNGGRVLVKGDVVAVRSTGLDLSMWRLGGAAVPLRLVQLANSPHELSRTLSVLTGALRNSWQNSDDMERLRGYEILADILRNKSELINMTSFETLFEFLGLSFRAPDQSTVVNTDAYRAIALELQLWARTKTEIQRAHFEHFTMILQTSRYKRFNLKQRVGKMGVTRKFLFALQTDWYQLESVPWLVESMGIIASADFSTDNVVKPIVAYLVANLHHGSTGTSTPRSYISRIDNDNSRLKAEQVLLTLVEILRNPTAFTKFASVLPLTRICLLLLGDRPSPAIATSILRIVELGLISSTSFSRKFELVSGWNVLKYVLPYAWSPSVHAATFDILLGRASNSTNSGVTVVCPQILPAIFAALQTELEVVAGCAMPDMDHIDPIDAARDVEKLLEELIGVHASSPSFRQVFKSQTTTQSYIDAYRSFIMGLSSLSELPQPTIRILDKINHLSMTISLDDTVTSAHKKELLDSFQSAEAVSNPDSSRSSTPSMSRRSRQNRRFSSARLSVQLGERTVQRSISRINEWRKTVTATERKRLRKMILDLREQRRQIVALTEWKALLSTERGLWPTALTATHWRLDETEGPYRVRKKLEPDHSRVINSKVDQSASTSKVQEAEADAQSIMHVEMPPWAETYEFHSSNDTEENQLEEEVVDDKHRRVRHELEPGDVIEAADTVARIYGVDSSPGLLIFGRTHLYMLDGLVLADDGEVIDAHDAPKKLFFVPGSIIELNGPQRAQRWPYDQVSSYSDRTFLFRDVGLEIYFKDSRSLLVVFLEKSKRHAITERLSQVADRPPTDSVTPGILKSPLVSRISARMSARVSAKALVGFRQDELSTAQRKWQAREISNFSYISILNQVSGRTPCDATQYPVFPWVISDYTSENLNLDAAISFRDLGKPMGALSPIRREAAQTRYTNLQSVDEKPFHYGTHFSSSMIVCHFLIRLEPFTHMFKTLQGGDWDLPDRLFSNICRAYESASQDLRGDVRELIPEFFACPEFLENADNLDFGVQQNTGERIHDVKLPPWAKQDPLLFITLNRQALESDYVSRNLPSWIDLIWGCKQRDPDAVNVFHPLSYEGSIDLDSITDELEREATVGIIHNFGQTPRKLFNHSHPERMMHGSSTLPIGTIYGIAEDYHLLAQGTKVIKDIGAGISVRELVLDLIGEKIVPCPEGILTVPSHPHETIEWESVHTAYGEMRVLVDKKAIQVVEAALCSCAAFADGDTLVSGATDYTVRLWRLSRSSTTPLHVSLTHIMRGHTAPVLCVTASRAWSIVVSGSRDGSAVLWDLNRGTYMRSIWHGQGQNHGVHLVAINESTGYIASCSRDKLWLHTVNARPITVLDLANTVISPSYPPITSMAFHEREYSHIGVLATGAPDGTITLRTWNANKTPSGEKARWRFETLKKVRAKTAEGETLRRETPCITALRFVGETLYHGEDSGKVYCWDLPE